MAVARFLLERLSGVPTNSLFTYFASSEANPIRLMASASGSMQSFGSNSPLGNHCPIRWIFRHSTWEPTEAQWRQALSCVPSKEQEKILRYFHRRDAKASLVSQLMMREVVSDRLDIPYSKVYIDREPRGKPFVSLSNKTSRFSFNAAHDREVTIIAADSCRAIGSDVMKIDIPFLTFYQSTTPLAHMNLAAPKVFLQRMSKQLTPRERAWLFAPESEPERLARFYRLWCLKEAYVKCTGLGIGGGDKLTDLDFEVSSAHQTLAAGQFAADTRGTLRGQPLAHMRFEETVVELPNAPPASGTQSPREGANSSPSSTQFVCAVAIDTRVAGSETVDQALSGREVSSLQAYRVVCIEELLSRAEPLDAGAGVEADASGAGVGTGGTGAGAPTSADTTGDTAAKEGGGSEPPEALTRDVWQMYLEKG